MNKTAVRLLKIIPMLMCMCLIFCLSAQPRQESASTSGHFSNFALELWETVFGCDEVNHDAHISISSVIVRKGAHITLYAILALTVFIALYTNKRVLWKTALLSFALSALYAASDEFHQLFVPGRGAMFTDVLVDCVGIILSLTVCMLVMRKREEE